MSTNNPMAAMRHAMAGFTPTHFAWDTKHDGRVGVLIQHDRLRRGIGVEEVLDVRDSGTKLVALLERREHRPSRAALDVRHIGRELRTEDEAAISRIEERFAEELLEDFRPRPDDDVGCLSGDIELGLHEPRSRLAKLGQAGRRAVVRLIVGDHRQRTSLASDRPHHHRYLRQCRQCLHPLAIPSQPRVLSTEKPTRR